MPQNELEMLVAFNSGNIAIPVAPEGCWFAFAVVDADEAAADGETPDSTISATVASRMVEVRPPHQRYSDVVTGRQGLRLSPAGAEKASAAPIVLTHPEAEAGEKSAVCGLNLSR